MTVVRGASPRPIQEYITDDTLMGIPWIKIGDVPSSSKYVTTTKERITKEGAKHSRFLHKGDFILSNSMSFGRPYILSIDGCIHDGWVALSDFEKEVSSDYLYYVLNSTQTQNYWKRKANAGGAMTNLNADIIRSTMIPIPTKEMQSKIVSILNKFESYTNDLSEGLPAEIKARQQQYEYYRDQLLTFKRAN